MINSTSNDATHSTIEWQKKTKLTIVPAQINE